MGSNANLAHMPDNRDWRVNLILRSELRDAVEGIASRSYKGNRYRITVSELVRASLDSAVEKLKGENFRDLREKIDGLGEREASPIVERWLREKLGE